MQQTINNQQQEQATTSENQEAQQPTANNHKKQTPRITREDCCTVVCRFLFADEVWCCCGRYYHPDVSAQTVAVFSMVLALHSLTNPPQMLLKLKDGQTNGLTTMSQS